AGSSEVIARLLVFNPPLTGENVTSTVCEAPGASTGTCAPSVMLKLPASLTTCMFETVRGAFPLLLIWNDCTAVLPTSVVGNDTEVGTMICGTTPCPVSRTLAIPPLL